jgi:polyisoprenoid-binding protein YceI
LNPFVVSLSNHIQTRLDPRFLGWFFAAGLMWALPALHASGQPATYRVDALETTAGYETRFLGVLPMRGDFKRSSGTLIYDPVTRSGSVEVRIEAASMISSTVKAEATARGRDFFNVERYPFITFSAANFTFDSDRLRTVDGALTLVGITKPVTLVIRSAHCEPLVCRAEGEVEVQRSMFGMKAWSRMVSDEVTIRISLVARLAGAETAATPVTEAPPVVN